RAGLSIDADLGAGGGVLDAVDENAAEPCDRADGSDRSPRPLDARCQLSAPARREEQRDADKDGLEGSIHSWVRSVLNVVEARAEPDDPVRVVRRVGAGLMRREPGVDTFQECFTLLLQKSLTVGRRARVDAVVH